MEEYLTVREVAERLRLSAKTVRNRMYDGTWRRGTHWFRRRGIAPRFRWSAVIAWLEGPEDDDGHSEGAAFGGDIPSARQRLARRRRHDHDPLEAEG